MIRNIFNEMTSRGIYRLIASIVCFVLYALCGTAIMLVVLYAIDNIVAGQAVRIPVLAWILIGLLVFKTIANSVADMSKHYAGFDLVEQIRQKIILNSIFSLDFIPMNAWARLTPLSIKM